MSEDESASEEEEAAPQAKPAPKPKATPKPAKATPKKEAAPAEEKEKAQEDPAAKVPAAQLKADVEAIMDKMNDEELGQMTAKTIIQALKEQYKFEVKSRKAEIKEVVHAYADRRLGSGAQAAAAGDA